MKKLILTVLALSVITVFTLGLSERPPKAVKPESIKVGVVLPLTGDGAAYGQKEKNGVELAIIEANKAGGIDGGEIIAVYEDSKGIPAPATAALQKLIAQDGVQVTIGGAFSSPTLAMVPIANKEKVALMSPSASSPELTGSSDYFFRVWPSDVSEASITAEVAIKDMNLSSFAVLYGNNDYGLGLKNVFIETVKKLGGKVLIVDSYNEGDTDFRTQLAKIKEASPDAIYLGGYYKEFAKILIQAREMGIGSQFLSCGTFHEPELLKIAGNAAEGVVFVQPYFDRDSKDPTIQQFVKDYENKFGIEAGVYAAHGYDAMKVVIAAMKEGGLSADAIKNTLLELKNYPGVTGKTTFIKGGDVIKPARVMTVKDGKFTDFEN